MIEMTMTEEYRKYYDDVYQNLAIAYTTNANFVDDYVNLAVTTWTQIGNSYLLSNGERFKCDTHWIENAATRSTYNLNNGEIVMSVTDYNKIFGTNYSTSTLSQFVPHDVTFQYSYYYDTDSAKVALAFDAKIVRLIEGSVTYYSQDIFDELLRCNTYTSGLYFDDLSNVSTVMQTADQNGFFANSVVIHAVAILILACAFVRFRKVYTSHNVIMDITIKKMLIATNTHINILINL